MTKMNNLFFVYYVVNKLIVPLIIFFKLFVIIYEIELFPDNFLHFVFQRNKWEIEDTILYNART